METAGRLVFAHLSMYRLVDESDPRFQAALPQHLGRNWSKRTHAQSHQAMSYHGPGLVYIADMVVKNTVDTVDTLTLKRCVI